MKKFFAIAIAGLAAIAGNQRAWSAGEEFADIKAQVTKQHDEAVKRLQDWIHQVSIAAENRGYPEGPDYMIKLLKEAGFDKAEQVPTDGKPGVFATLDAGAKKTVGLYFMYDVKQFDPKEWSSSPTDAAIVDKPGFGKCVVGRGAVNQKGPEATFLAALHAIRAAGKKLPVNLAFVAEGEEEIGSPHFPQIVHTPEVQAALAKCEGIFIPSADQNPDGTLELTLGAKGVVEVELTSSGEKWGRGPKKDVHSSTKAELDSPAWHLVQALHTLVSADGNDPAIDNYTKNVRPITAEEKKMVADASKRLSEAEAKKLLTADHWIHDVNWEKALELLVSRPTVNIEGLVGGYTGPGGKTILPHKASAKLDLRLVPNMTAADAVADLKAHLAKRGFGDIEVNMTGGYDPNSTSVHTPFIQAQIAVMKKAGIDPIILPRSAGSWPGYVFTNAPLSKPAGGFGLGHGSGAHAPDEYFVVESSNPKVQGMDGATMAFVEYLYELGKD
jgi:acetylornithine deacetylase/succinyl-diaminopimelate desuccinylase-like protein